MIDMMNCRECNKKTKVAFYHSAGDIVCAEYRLLLEAHSIDDMLEWTTFTNEMGDDDLVCVGVPPNPLLTNGGLSTVISKPNGVSREFISSSLGHCKNHMSNIDFSLIMAFKTIGTMSDHACNYIRRRWWSFAEKGDTYLLVVGHYKGEE